MRRASKTKKNPWPTQESMQQVYDMKLWGGRSFDFYSGDGSHHPELVHPYVEVVNSFLSSFKIPLVVCDLGCGDFNVGRNLIAYTQKYLAVDIVQPLIQRNKKLFKHNHLEFYHLDIAKQKLPSGDCALVRQVLQHLSNAEIQRISDKLKNLQYVILTEHIPKGDFIPNKDIISGQGIRLKQKSGVDLLAAPFNLKIKTSKTLLQLTPKKYKGVIETILYEMF